MEFFSELHIEGIAPTGGVCSVVDLPYLYYKAVRFCGLDEVQNPARNERENCPKAELQTPGSDSGLERPLNPRAVLSRVRPRYRHLL